MKLNRRHFWMLLAVLCLATLPWLGMSDFHTKGEPREAIVGLTMLEQGNWILPHNNGGEMAYKPPFFHWTIAATSALAGGVSEWTARFPSALAAIALMMWMYVFYARRRDSGTALLATLICFTTFEVFRAAFACRVDMMQALGIAGAMFAFAAWAGRERRGVPWLAILMMSLGTLTKGPVAIVLPCGVTGVYLLLRRESLWRTMGWMTLSGTLALVLPALWYWAAWQQGGDEFLALVKEENVDRFLGRMTYRSHENGLWYYFVMLPAGLLPWVLPAVAAWWSRRHGPTNLARWQKLSPETLYSLVAFVLVFAFYCIPMSKRGVYLLPLYPFAAWFIAIALRHWSLRMKQWVVGTVLALYVVAFAVVVPLTVNRRSDIDIARDIQAMRLDGPLRSYFAVHVAGNPLHFFTINFYLNDGVDNWDGQTDGYLLVGQCDAEQFRKEHPEVGLRHLYTSRHRSCDLKQTVHLYQLFPARSCSK